MADAALARPNLQNRTALFRTWTEAGGERDVYLRAAPVDLLNVLFSLWAPACLHH